MNLKMAVAGASLAGGVGLALIGLNPVVANADPCGPPGAQCGPGAPGGPHGPSGPPGGQPRDFHQQGPSGPPDNLRGNPPGDRQPGGNPPGDRQPGGNPPGDWHPGGNPPGDWHGPGNWGPRPPDAFRGWHNAPWADGPAPWGWGAPPPPAWDGPLPDPFGPPPPPINYWGYNEQPVWDPGQNQWGFWFFGIWIPL